MDDTSLLVSAGTKYTTPSTGLFQTPEQPEKKFQNRLQKSKPRTYNIQSNVHKRKAQLVEVKSKSKQLRDENEHKESPHGKVAKSRID
jgi:hypothetical protein